MSNLVKIAPPNSLLFVSDTGGGDAPMPVRGARILSTPSCVSIACLAFMDGETDVTLGRAATVAPASPPAFDGVIATPSRSVVVSTVERETVLEEAVADGHTRVRVWVNRPREPDVVIIGLG